jgi:antitoxin Xre/MbcA/ParS-like protein
MERNARSATGRQAARAPEPAVVTKAALRAADRLQLSHKTLGRIIGVSEATVSRMAAGSYLLAKDAKPFELAMVLIRLFRSLDAVVSGDEAAAAAWLRAQNTALGSTPLELMQSVTGLVHVLAYLDARRALA